LSAMPRPERESMSYVRVSTVERLLTHDEIEQIEGNAKAALQAAITSVGKQPQAYVTREYCQLRTSALAASPSPSPTQRLDGRT
jgi:hypothetical protein